LRTFVGQGSHWTSSRRAALRETARGHRRPGRTDTTHNLEAGGGDFSARAVASWLRGELPQCPFGGRRAPVLPAPVGVQGVLYRRLRVCVPRSISRTTTADSLHTVSLFIG